MPAPAAGAASTSQPPPSAPLAGIEQPSGSSGVSLQGGAAGVSAASTPRFQPWTHVSCLYNHSDDAGSSGDETVIVEIVRPASESKCAGAADSAFDANRPAKRRRARRKVPLRPPPDERPGWPHSPESRRRTQPRPQSQSQSQPQRAVVESTPPAPRLVCVEENPGPGHGDGVAEEDPVPGRGDDGPAEELHRVKRILRSRAAGRSRASRRAWKAGVLEETDFMVEWENDPKATWNPAVNHLENGVLEPVAAQFLRHWNRTARARSAPRGRSSARRGRSRRASSVGCASSTPTLESESDTDTDDHVSLQQWYEDHKPLSLHAANCNQSATGAGTSAAAAAGAAAAAVPNALGGKEDHMSLQQWYEDHKPLSLHVANCDAASRQLQLEQAAASAAVHEAPELAVTAAEAKDANAHAVADADAVAGADAVMPPAPASGASWQAAGWHTLFPHLPQSLIPDGTPAAARASCESDGTQMAPVNSESVVPTSGAGAAGAAAASHSAAELATAAYQVSRVERIAGSDWHRWRYLDALLFPCEAALLAAMRQYYTSSRMQYWQQFCSQERRLQLDALCEATLSATEAVALFADWMLEAMQPAAAGAAAGTAPSPHTSASNAPQPAPVSPLLQLCPCCIKWQDVLDQLHFEEHDKQQTLREWHDEPVWLCVYTRL